MVTFVFRALLVFSGLAAFFVSGLLMPLYRARPDLLRGEAGLLVPPGLLVALLWAGAVFAAIVFLERFFQPVRATLVTYAPLMALNVFLVAIFPGMPLVSDALWWLVIDARVWVVTIVIGAIAYRRLPALALDSRRVFAVAVFALVIALTPSRRFGQPYDARWGTGDEPRYVRITASLLHDADAEIGNAEENIGRRAPIGRFLGGVLGWIPSAVETAWEVIAPGRVGFARARARAASPGGTGHRRA